MANEQNTTETKTPPREYLVKYSYTGVREKRYTVGTKDIVLHNRNTVELDPENELTKQLLGSKILVVYSPPKDK